MIDLPRRQAPRRLGLFLAACILVFAGGGLISDILRVIWQDPTPAQRHLIWLWQLDYENNLPTRFSALLLAGNGVLLLVLAWRLVRPARGATTPLWRDRLVWAGFGLLFFALATDEMNSLHERVGRALSAAVGLEGTGWRATWIPWVIPGLALAALALLTLRGALSRLPHTSRGRFLRAGLVYVSGAVGFEILGAVLLQLSGPTGLYVAGTFFEELLEMTGQAMFMVALVDLIGQLAPRSAPARAG